MPEQILPVSDGCVSDSDAGGQGRPCHFLLHRPLMPYSCRDSIIRGIQSRGWLAHQVRTHTGGSPCRHLRISPAFSFMTLTCRFDGGKEEAMPALAMIPAAAVCLAWSTRGSRGPRGSTRSEAHRPGSVALDCAGSRPSSNFFKNSSKRVYCSLCSSAV